MALYDGKNGPLAGYRLAEDYMKRDDTKVVEGFLEDGTKFKLVPTRVRVVFEQDGDHFTNNYSISEL